MNIEDPKLSALAGLHEISIAANRMLASIDSKLEGVTTETIEVNVAALHTLRLIVATQDDVLRKMTEASARFEDKLDAFIDTLPDQHK